MATLEKTVETEWLNPRAKADVAEALAAGEQGNYDSDEPLGLLSRQHQGKGVTIPRKGFSEWDSQERWSHLEREVNLGERSFAEYNAASELRQPLRTINRGIELYTDFYREGAKEKVDNLLGNLEKIPFIGKGFGVLRQAYNELVHPYREPSKISAMYSGRGNLGAFAYALIGKNRLGMPYGMDTIGTAKESMFFYTDYVRRLGLYDDPDSLALYFVAHEIEELNNPNAGEDEQEKQSHELEVRVNVLNQFRSLANNERDPYYKRKYSNIAKVAQFFVMQYIGHPSALQAPRPLYSPEGRIEKIDAANLYGTPGSGSLSPAAQKEYRAEIGQPLPDHEVKSEQHTPEQHSNIQQHQAAPNQPAQNQPGYAASSQHSPQEHQAAQN